MKIKDIKLFVEKEIKRLEESPNKLPYCRGKLATYISVNDMLQKIKEVKI